MIRDHALGFAAVATALVSLGGALAIARAQQAPGAAPPKADTAARGADAVPRAANQPGTGATFGGQGGGRGSAAPVGFPPGKSPRAAGGAGMMGPMAMAIDDDPEMAELAQAEAALANESEEMLGRFAETENAADRKQLAAELRQTLAKQFDVQRKRRELELSRIEERVRKLRDQIKKRDDARETIIDRRLDLLINDADGLGWSPPASSSERGSAKSSGTGFGPPRGTSSPNFPRR
jgi:hypothetical protein